MIMFKATCITPGLNDVSKTRRCFPSPLRGPFLLPASRASHPLEEAFQSGAAGWEALLLVHLWTQQETGQTHSSITLVHWSSLIPTMLTLSWHGIVFQPFCDGAHKFKAQGLSPLRFVPDKDATVWLCGCKHTQTPPYCDGTHKQAFIVSAPLHQLSDSWKESQVHLRLKTEGFSVVDEESHRWALTRESTDVVWI